MKKLSKKTSNRLIDVGYTMTQIPEFNRYSMLPNADKEILIKTMINTDIPNKIYFIQALIHGDITPFAFIKIILDYYLIEP